MKAEYKRTNYPSDLSNVEWRKKQNFSRQGTRANITREILFKPSCM